VDSAEKRIFAVRKVMFTVNKHKFAVHIKIRDSCEPRIFLRFDLDNETKILGQLRKML